MKSLKEAIFIAAIFILCSTNCLVSVQDDVGNANDFIDGLFHQILEEDSIVQTLEPVALPNITEKDFITWNGIVHGLSNLHRHGNCTYSLDNERNTVTLSTEIAASNISFAMKYKVKIVFLWIEGDMEGQIDELGVNMVLSLNNKAPTLDSFQVIHFGKFEITRVTFLGFISSWILKQVANTVATRSKEQIVNALESGVSSFLRKLLADVDFNDV